jgi:hypothetical protein
MPRTKRLDPAVRVKRALAELDAALTEINCRRFEKAFTRHVDIQRRAKERATSFVETIKRMLPDKDGGAS